MWLPLLITCIALVAATDPKEQEPCYTCVKVDSICHNVTHITNLQAPFRETVVITKLGILKSKNILYYAFEPNITDPEYYKIGYVNLDVIGDQGLLEGSEPIVNFTTFAFDQPNNIIYIGGGDAIHVLENNAPKAAFYSSKGDRILSILFHKNHLYFIRYGEQIIIEKEGLVFRPITNYTNVKNFVIDRNNMLVFLNTSGLYVHKLYTKTDIVQISRNPFFRGLTVDLDGKVYAWYIDGIYRVKIANDIHHSKIERIAEIPNIGAVTFDNVNNFMLTSSRGLYRLINMNTTLC